MKFFDAIKKLDWYDPYRHYKGTRSLNKNWCNFEHMFDLRNEIVHSMKTTDLSVKEITSLCDNSLNVMDAGDLIGLMESMDEIVRIMKSKISKRDEIRAVYG